MEISKKNIDLNIIYMQREENFTLIENSNTLDLTHQVSVDENLPTAKCQNICTLLVVYFNRKKIIICMFYFNFQT